MYTVDQAYNILVDGGIATDNEIGLVTYINGYSVETMEDILYARTGYRDFDQFTGEDSEDSEDFE
jgi:hypothetical protein